MEGIRGLKLVLVLLSLVVLSLPPLLVLFSANVVVVLVIVVLVVLVVFWGIGTAAAVTLNVVVADARLYPLAETSTFT